MAKARLLQLSVEKEGVAVLIRCGGHHQIRIALGDRLGCAQYGFGANAAAKLRVVWARDAMVSAGFIGQAAPGDREAHRLTLFDINEASGFIWGGNPFLRAFFRAMRGSSPRRNWRRRWWRRVEDTLRVGALVEHAHSWAGQVKVSQLALVIRNNTRGDVGGFLVLPVEPAVTTV